MWLESVEFEVTRTQNSAACTCSDELVYCVRCVREQHVYYNCGEPRHPLESREKNQEHFRILRPKVSDCIVLFILPLKVDVLEYFNRTYSFQLRNCPEPQGDNDNIRSRRLCF